MGNNVYLILQRMETMLAESIRAGLAAPAGFPNIREVIGEYRAYLNMQPLFATEGELSSYAARRRGTYGY